MNQLNTLESVLFCNIAQRGMSALPELLACDKSRNKISQTLKGMVDKGLLTRSDLDSKYGSYQINLEAVADAQVYINGALISIRDWINSINRSFSEMEEKNEAETGKVRKSDQYIVADFHTTFLVKDGVKTYLKTPFVHLKRVYS